MASEFRLVLNSTVVPSGYSCGHRRSHCDIYFIDLVLQYLPFFSSTLYKTHVSPVIFSITDPATYGAFSEDDESAFLGVNFYFPINLSL